MLMRKVSYIVASGLGSGLSPILSGTTGSAALIIVWFFTYSLGIFSDPVSFTLTCCVLIACGLGATRMSISRELPKVDSLGREKIDPGYVVIDEWAGMLIALYGLAPGEYLKIVIAFILFRAFDIIKPGPVRWLEGLPREWGIMADDVAAGLLALLVRVLCGI